VLGVALTAVGLDAASVVRFPRGGAALVGIGGYGRVRPPPGVIGFGAVTSSDGVSGFGAVHSGCSFSCFGVLSVFGALVVDSSTTGFNSGFLLATGAGEDGVVGG